MYPNICFNILDGTGLKRSFFLVHNCRCTFCVPLLVNSVSQSVPTLRLHKKTLYVHYYYTCTPRTRSSSRYVLNIRGTVIVVVHARQARSVRHQIVSFNDRVDLLHIVGRLYSKDMFILMQLSFHTNLAGQRKQQIHLLIHNISNQQTIKRRSFVIKFLSYHQEF